MVFLSKSTPPFAMSGPMNSIGLFSFFPHKSELETAIGGINHTVLGSGFVSRNRHFAQISMGHIAVLCHFA